VWRQDRHYYACPKSMVRLRKFVLGLTMLAPIVSGSIVLAVVARPNLLFEPPMQVLVASAVCGCFVVFLLHAATESVAAWLAMRRDG